MFGFRTASAVDYSIEQDLLLHEKEIVYPTVGNVIYEHEKSQQNSEEIEGSKTLVGMPTFTIKETEKHRQLTDKMIKFKLKHIVSVGETGIVIQPLLCWLAASPDGLITDESITPILGLIEIKRPFSKRNLHPQNMLKDKNFYVELRDGMPHLKEEHSNGYYSQIQMAMGLSQLKFCDFIVYSFKGMIIIRICFSEIYFIKLTEKLNHFFKNYALPYLIKMN